MAGDARGLKEQAADDDALWRCAGRGRPLGSLGRTRSASLPSPPPPTRLGPRSSRPGGGHGAPRWICSGHQGPRSGPLRRGVRGRPLLPPCGSLLLGTRGRGDEGGRGAGVVQGHGATPSPRAATTPPSRPTRSLSPTPSSTNSRDLCASEGGKAGEEFVVTTGTERHASCKGSPALPCPATNEWISSADTVR